MAFRSRSVIVLWCAIIYTTPAWSESAWPGGDDHTTKDCEPVASTWTDAERWAWLRICNGQIADFNEREGRPSGKELAPSDRERWNVDRMLTPSFLRTILISNIYRKKLENQSAYFRGAWIREPLDLRNAKLPSLFGLEWSRIDANLDLSGVQSDFPLYLDSSVVSGNVKINSSKFGPLTMPLMLITGDLELTGTQINGYWWASGLRVQGRVGADLVHVSGHLMLNDAKLSGPSNFENDSVDASLDVSGGEFASLDLGGSTIRGSLRIAQRDEQSDVIRIAKFPAVGGKDSDQSRLVLQGVSVGSWVGSRDGWPPMDLAGFKYSYFEVLDMGEGVDLGKWGVEFWLVKDLSGWSQPYEQYAETISKMGFESEANQVRFAEREKQREQSSGVRWLLLSGSRYFIGYGYGSGYFNTLAWMLGLILFARFLVLVMDENGEEKDSEDRRPSYLLASQGMLLQLIAESSVIKSTKPRGKAFIIGSILWAMLAITSYYFLKRQTGKEKSQDGRDEQKIDLLYCVDVMLPFIQFRGKTGDIKLRSRILFWYFVFHRAAGYVLASFVLAGLAGLTK